MKREQFLDNYQTTPLPRILGVFLDILCWLVSLLHSVKPRSRFAKQFQTVSQITRKVINPTGGRLGDQRGFMFTHVLLFNILAQLRSPGFFLPREKDPGRVWSRATQILGGHK